MTITLVFQVWWIPTIITIVCFGYAIFIHDDGGGMFSGLGNIMLCAVAGSISTVAWIVYAILK